MSLRNLRSYFHSLTFQLANDTLQSARRTSRVEHTATVTEGAHGFLCLAHTLFRCAYFGHGQSDGVVLGTATHGINQRFTLGEHGFRQPFGHDRIIGFNAQSDDTGFRIKGRFYCPFPIGKAFIPRGASGKATERIMIMRGKMLKNPHFAVNSFHNIWRLNVFRYDMRIRAHGRTRGQKHGGKATCRTTRVRTADGKPRFCNVHGRSQQAEIEQG